MTAGDIYTVAGSSSGTSGHTGDGGAATSALLDGPTAWRSTSAGDLYIADSGNNRVQEVAATTAHTMGHFHDRRRHLHRRWQLVGHLGPHR